MTIIQNTLVATGWATSLTVKGISQLATVDVLASRTMKDVATCDNSYVLQNQAYHHSFERTLRTAARTACTRYHSEPLLNCLGTLEGPREQQSKIFTGPEGNGTTR